MRLYAPAKLSSSTGEEDGRRQQHGNDSFQQRQQQQQQPQQHQREDNNNNKNSNNNNKNYHYDSRSTELTRRSIESINDHHQRLDDKLQLNLQQRQIEDKQPTIPSRLDDKFLIQSPLRDDHSTPTPAVESVTNTKKSPPKTNSSPLRTEINGVPTSTISLMSSTSNLSPHTTMTTMAPSSQNGPTNSLDYNLPPSPPLLENGTDSLRFLDSIPWNLEGTETIIENGSRSNIKNGSIPTEEDELKRIKEENKKLKAALDEAAEVNGQWRQYHDERQGYVQRLLTTIHELQHAHRSTAPSPRQLDGEGGTGSGGGGGGGGGGSGGGGSAGGQEGEVRRLREALTKLQAEHNEHVQLLEMQVRAHRDDWEAERSEKRSAEAALAETEARAALLLQELQLLQAKLADSESKRGLCWRCMGPRTDYNNHRSGSNSNPRTPQASPIPAPSGGGGGTSPGPVIPSAPPPDNPPVPLKGWIPVSMLHQIAFSGSTPEHQTPVVQSQPHQQSSRMHTQVQPHVIQNQQVSHQSQHHHQQKAHQQSQQQQQQQNYVKQQQMQQTQVKQQNLHVQQSKQHQHSQQHKQSSINCLPKSSSDFTQRNVSHENDTSNSEYTIKGIDDKKKYEAMGARPKVLGDLNSGLPEDEKSAKHRARSILASAIPVSPVSSGPSTSCSVSVPRSSSNTLKGYVPITSTILTPINFRPPFVAHKRPSAIKHTGQNKASSQAPLSNIVPLIPPTHVRSDSSPASLCIGSNTNTNMSRITNQASTSISKNSSNTKGKQESVGKLNISSNVQTVSQFVESKKSPSPGSKKKSSNNLKVEQMTHRDNKSALQVDKTKVSEGNEGFAIVTTTISCSSPSTVSTTTSSASSVNMNKTNYISKTGDILENKVPVISTAFASIVVTTTVANNVTTTNTTSSSTSSRSSSPGMSLTTFGLNSEGRGIPGAICFALGSDQKSVKNSQQSNQRLSNSSVMSPTSEVSTAGQSQKDARPHTGVMSPTITITNATPSATVKEEHWWSVESPGRSKQQNSGKLVNSTWVRLMGGQANNKSGSGLPWRTARAVSGQHLDQARKHSDGTSSPNSIASSTATFNYTPAVNSPPSSNLSSAANSAASSPPPNPNQPHGENLKSMASKNISSAILSYELSAKCDAVTIPSEASSSKTLCGSSADSSMNDGVVTMTRKDLVCPSCQMLFPPEKHISFLDHFELCRGPEYADL